MRKLTISTIILFIGAFSNLNAQNLFEKSNHFIDISLGGGSYNTTVNNPTDKNGDGGQTLLGINYEYALSNHWGIGAILELGGSENKDLNTKYSSSTFGIKGYYHFYNTEKTTFYASLALCGAGAKSENPFRTFNSIKGSGNNVQLGAGFKHKLFADWCAFHANLNLTRYTFSEWKTEFDDEPIKNNLGTEKLKIQMGGINFTTGLTFKF